MPTFEEKGYKYDTVDFTKGLKEQIWGAASAVGLSQSQWGEQAIRENMDRGAKEN